MNQLGQQSQPFLFVIDFAAHNALVQPLSEVNPEEMAFSIGGQHLPSELAPKLPSNIHFERDPVPFDRYQRAFEQVQAEIHQGNSYLLNLTFPTRIQTNLDLRTIYHYNEAPYKLWIKDQMVVFSPECFVQIRGGTIYSYPMKGTIRAELPGAAERLMADPKEKAEHATIVDLIRNDLGRIANQVRVNRFRYLDRVVTNRGTLYQTSSEISARLEEDYPARIGDLLFSLLPAGSISGAPKKKTVVIIQAAEQYDRGFYTGVFGVYDGQNLDSGVMIRFIEKTVDGLVFKSGGGITHLSKVEEEYEEMIDKVYLPFAVKADPILKS
jgi:para-aminobenzoate synthetase component 1